MWEFFRPWRRKIGFVTLVMACGFMTAWVRSYSQRDGVFINHNSLLSQAGCVYVAKDLPFQQSANSHQIDFDCSNLVWHFRFGGFELAESANTNHIFNRMIHAQLIVIPYWSVTIPLTFISAFLLLSKPRQSTQKKITEPVPNNGGATT